MATWRSSSILGGFAMVAAGAWLLSVAPDTDSKREEWRPGEPVAITPETGEQEWSWSFRLPNDGSQPVQAKVHFILNMSDVRKGDGVGDYAVLTLLYIDGEPGEGANYGGAPDDAGSWIRYRLKKEWTLQPGQESVVEARATNLVSPRPGTGWEVRYDPMRFEVTTTTQTLEWALAGPGTGLLLAGFAAVAMVAVPWRPPRQA